MLTELPAGARHTSVASRAVTATRLDIALPLAQFDISRARATGDLRFLGYAEAVLAPWMKQSAVEPQVLILHATILQSRHSFDAALAELDRALSAGAGDAAHSASAQAWLTRATVLRVLGRYDEAAFAFRLLHGFGFASVLADMGLPQGARLISLLAFNSGIEAGQMAVVLAVMPIMYGLRSGAFYRRAVMPWGSAAIAALAFLWLIQRATQH